METAQEATGRAEITAETSVDTLTRFDCSPGILGKILGQFWRLAQNAMVARGSGEPEKAKTLARQGYEFERMALDALPHDKAGRAIIIIRIIWINQCWQASLLFREATAPNTSVAQICTNV